MNRKLQDALTTQKKQTRREVQQLPGLLGIPINGARTVEVPTRNSYVYVRLRNNQSEVIQAFNNKVAQSYNLPVLVERQGNRYVVVSVDTQRYDNNWSSISPFLPRHGNAHSFDPASGGGGDVVWVHSRQIMPMLAIPSGSSGGPNVVISPFILRSPSGVWKYVGNSGTQNITPYKPTNNQALMVLVYTDSVSGNSYLLVGSGTPFAGNITGSAQIVPYIPQISNPDWIPNMAIRLVSGTNAIGWDNMYDVRPFFHNLPTGSSSGGGGGSSFDNFWTSGSSGQNSVNQKTPPGEESVVHGLVSVGFGGVNTISGSYGFIHGTGNTVVGQASHGEGTFNEAIGASNHIEGSNNKIFGTSNHMEGNNNFIYGDVNHAEGSNNLISGSFSFVNGVANENLANFSAMLGGSGNKLTAAALGSVMLGMNRHTGSRPDTTYVDKMFIKRMHPGPAVMNLGLDSAGWLVTGTAGGSSLTGSYMPEDGWIPVTDTWIRRSSSQFILSGNRTEVYRKGSRLGYYDTGGAERFTVITDSSFSSGTTTTVNVLANVTGNTGIPAGGTSGQRIGYVERPQRFPEYFDWTVSWTNLTVGNGTLVARINASTTCIVSGYINLLFGSTSSIGGDVSFNLPITTLAAFSGALALSIGIVQAVDQSAGIGYACILRTDDGTTGVLRRQVIPTTNLQFAAFSATQPFAWNTNDALSIPFSYQF